jgi:hypothetical protein
MHVILSSLNFFFQLEIQSLNGPESSLGALLELSCGSWDVPMDDGLIARPHPLKQRRTVTFAKLFYACSMK